MMRNSGERLFEAIGQIPEEIILEAEQDGLIEETGDSVQNLQERKSDAVRHDLSKNEDSDRVRSLQEEKGSKAWQGLQEEKGSDAGQNQQREEIGDSVRNLQENEGSAAVQNMQEEVDGGSHRVVSSVKKGSGQSRMATISGYLKYLPVAACLCLVCCGVFYVVNNYMGTDNSVQLSMSGGSSEGSVEESEDVNVSPDLLEDVTQEAGFDDKGSDGAALSGGAVPDQPSLLMPVRNDVYEGPILSMTATGDTHKLTTIRHLKGSIVTEDQGDRIQPLLRMRDTYVIKNTSKEDKMLQLVYPFVTTLNLAYDFEGEVLEVPGQDEKSISYNIGDSVRAYQEQPSQAASSVEDYQKLLEAEVDYQEHALEKEVDWSREVSVYTFSDIHIQEEISEQNYSGVVGVTVRGAKADVLTYGFDHSFEVEEGVSNYCFFIPEGETKYIMIVTGELEAEPELGFYSNLDCEELLDGVECDLKQEKMSYADALRLCSKLEARQVQQDYEQDVYDGELPEYFGVDAVFKALTVIGDEESFYDILIERYQNTELREIFEQLLGETRIVYAMATVMIPAGQSVQVTAQVHKRQCYGHYMLMGESSQASSDEEYQFDFIMNDKSHLNIGKASFRLALSADWQITEDNMGLRQKKSALRADLSEEKIYHINVSKSLG